jgi:uncharacterized membrane protein
MKTLFLTLQQRFQQVNFTIGFLIVNYLVGLVGTLGFSPDFMKLTPLNLVISFALLVFFHPAKESQLTWYAALVFVLGYLIEWLGVHSGVIFGVYWYGESLALKWDGVPVMIGLNWILTSYISIGTASWILAQTKRTAPPFALMLLAAILMVALDGCIEPVASRYDLWHWQNGIIPVQNFVAWFGFSVLFLTVFCLLRISRYNPLSPWVYALQAAYFIILNLAGAIR